MALSQTDPISDLLSRIQNTATLNRDFLNVPHSIQKERLLKLFKEAGFVSQIKVNKTDKPSIDITLNSSRPITRLRKISKSGRRVYVSAAEIPRVLEGSGITIISTSQGLMIGAKAKKRKLGGELICEVW